MNDSTPSRLSRTKTIILYSTIALLVVGAAIAIFMIFFGPTYIFGQLISTTLVLYLMAVLCMNNFTHINSSTPATRICSTIALIINLFWAIPWVLLIWDVFGVDSLYTEIIWRFMWTMLTLSLYFTIMSTQLPFMKNFSGLTLVKQAIQPVLVSYLFINALVFIWTVAWSNYYGPFADADLIIKLVCAELILLLLQWAIPEILLRSQQGNKLDQNNKPKQS